MDENFSGRPNPLNPNSNMGQPGMQIPITNNTQSGANPINQNSDQNFEQTRTIASNPAQTMPGTNLSNQQFVNRTAQTMPGANLNNQQFGNRTAQTMPGANLNNQQFGNRTVSSMNNPMQSPNTPIQSTRTAPNMVQNISQMRPMERAPIVATEPPKKKNKIGLIIGIAIASLLVVTGIVVAIFLVMNSGDPVSRAIEKVASGQMPENVAMDGTIEITPVEDETGFMSATITLDSHGTSNSLINTTSAQIALTFKDVGTINLSADEIYPSNGVLYLKVSNIVNALNDYYNSTANTIDATDTDEETINSEIFNETDGITDYDTNTFLDNLSSAIVDLDGQWLKISISDFEELISGSTNRYDCTTSLISEVKNNNNLAQIYSNNAFISSETKNVAIASKQSKVYQVIIDNEKLNGFIDGVNESSFMSNYEECMDSDETYKIDPIDVNSIPDFYVEIDNDYNFTRLYVSDTLGDDEDTSLTADINLSYPENINVAKPEGAIDLIDVLQIIFSDTDMSNEDWMATLETE